MGSSDLKYTWFAWAKTCWITGKLSRAEKAIVVQKRKWIQILVGCICKLRMCDWIWIPWWSSAGSSKSLPGPPWWTRCRGWKPPGSSWFAGPARPADWSQPEQSSVRNGKPHGLHAVPGSPPESCTSLGLSDPPLHSQTSCWKPMPSWQMSETSLQPGVEKIWSLRQVQMLILS